MLEGNFPLSALPLILSDSLKKFNGKSCYSFMFPKYLNNIQGNYIAFFFFRCS